MKCDAEENNGSVVQVHMPKLMKITNVTEIYTCSSEDEESDFEEISLMNLKYLKRL